MLKNDILLRALEGESLSRPPVWMMRQAGRYLPDFMKLKAKYDFFTRCQTPELATEITIMPIDSNWNRCCYIIFRYFSYPTSDGYCSRNERRCWSVASKPHQDNRRCSTSKRPRRRGQGFIT